MNTRHLLSAVTIALAAVVATNAQAHARLVESQPKAGSDLASSPKEIRLHFNEKLEPAFSKIELIDAKETKLALPKAEVDKADPKVLFTAVPALQPGAYRIRWSTMTHDGHKVKGELAFLVK